MKYQKLINLLDNTSSQPSKFRTKNWIEIIVDLRRTYDINIQIKFKTSVLKSSLCDYSNAYIYVKRAITVPNKPAAVAAANGIGKIVIFKNVLPFSDCISETSNTQADNTKDIDGVMPINYLIEYNHSYLETSESSWKYY